MKQLKQLKQLKKRWYDYLWIASLLYLTLGFFNILFAWLGLICFLLPLALSISSKDKVYCNKYCGRGQLFELLGGRFNLSRRKNPPPFLRSAWFRYSFLTFFMAMFGLMIFTTLLVFQGKPLSETVKLLWMFNLPWRWTHTDWVFPWVAQFAFGFYGVMLTSTVLGLITMILFKPRSWCAYCPMGTMTQCICKLKYRKEESVFERESESNRGAFKNSGKPASVADYVRFDGEQ
jgi:polyferredoxin